MGQDCVMLLRYIVSQFVQYLKSSGSSFGWPWIEKLPACIRTSRTVGHVHEWSRSRTYIGRCWHKSLRNPLYTVKSVIAGNVRKCKATNSVLGKAKRQIYSLFGD